MRVWSPDLMHWIQICWRGQPDVIVFSAQPTGSSRGGQALLCFQRGSSRNHLFWSPECIITKRHDNGWLCKPVEQILFFFNPKQIILLNLKWPPNEIQEVLCRGKPNKRRWNRGRRGGHAQYLPGGWTPLRWSSYPFFPTPSSPLTPRNVLCSISQWENTIGTSLKNSNWKCVWVLKWVQM